MRKLSGYGPSLIVLATAMLVLFLGPSAVQQLTYKQTEARMIQASRRLESGTILEQISQAYRDIADLVEPSVVHISAQPVIEDRSGFASISLSSGSGWIFDEDGHVVTNYHVVKDAQRIEVQLSSGELREAEMVGYDNSTDIAVLRIPPGRLHPAVVGDLSEPVKQGDLVFTFGSPFDFRFSMSSGIVSGKGRYVGVIRDQVGRTGYENFIQVDAAINPGNSGGPLTDFRGRVIGMNTAIATGRGSTLEEGQFAGIGLAIPLEMIQPVVSQIIEKGVVEKGYLGVNVWDLNGAVREHFGFDGEGVRILSVEPEGPAARAGVQTDDIVTAVGDQPVASRPQLQSMISSMLPGETIKLTIWRRDPESGLSQTLTVSVTLARLPTLRARGELPEDQSLERIPELGLAKMSTSTPDLAERFGAPFYEGVIIERLVPGSRLARQVVPGSTIIAVMDEPVANAEQFLDLLRRDHDLRLGVRVALVTPDGMPYSVTLRVEQ
jgi:serine protease Do